MQYKNDFIFLVILNILDMLTTITFIGYGIATEGNPLMLLLFNNWGFMGMLMPKVVFLLFFAYVLTKYAKELKKSTITKYGMRFLNVFYVGVVALNLSIIIPYFTEDFNEELHEEFNIASHNIKQPKTLC